MKLEVAKLPAIVENLFLRVAQRKPKSERTARMMTIRPTSRLHRSLPHPSVDGGKNRELAICSLWLFSRPGSVCPAPPASSGQVCLGLHSAGAVAPRRARPPAGGSQPLRCAACSRCARRSVSARSACRRFAAWRSSCFSASARARCCSWVRSAFARSSRRCPSSRSFRRSAASTSLRRSCRRASLPVLCGALRVP